MKPIIALVVIAFAGYVVFSCYQNKPALVTGGNNLNARLCVYFNAGSQ